MRYIIFDLEATCWRGRPPKGITEIIEIGAIKVDRYGDVTGRFSKFVKPIINPLLSGFCKQLTSITQQNVDSAQKYNRVIEEFMEWAEMYDDEYILLSWGVDDRKLLANDCHLHRIDDEFINQYVDLKKAYRDLKKLKYASGLKSTVKKEGFDFTGLHHRAISDAENLAKVFVKYLEDWDLYYPRDNDMKSFLIRLSEKIDLSMERLGGGISWLTAVLMVIICIDVILRYLFSSTKTWVIELEWHLFSIIFLVGAAYTLLYDKHVRVDVFYEKFSRKKKSIVNVLGILLFLIPWSAVVIYYGWEYAMNSFYFKESSSQPNGLPARYIIKSFIAIGFILLVIQGISELIRNILRNNE